MQIAMISLGCAKNQVDSELMQGLLCTRGDTLVNEHTQADVVIVNTCSFITAAKEESIEAILRAARLKQGRCKALVVTGCLSQRYAAELMGEIPEIDALVGTNSFPSIGEVIDRAVRGERVTAVDGVAYAYEDEIERTPTEIYSVYVKVAEGCDNICSYCVIPLVRGKYRSRRMESIVREVLSLAQKGAREINLIAQDTTHYGCDLYGESRLPELLSQLSQINEVAWLRVLYCYPDGFTPELIGAISSLPRVCKYIDLPLQHINQRVLADMNRRGTPAEISRLLMELRAQIEDVTIRTTFIVGFPGETEAEFLELRDFVAEGWFDHVGVFKYSREEGTPAETMPNQISEEVKDLRYHELMALQQKVSQRRNQRFVGQTVDVLVEEPWPKGLGIKGRARKDAPLVDGAVYVRDTSASKGQLIRAHIEEALEYDLLGVVAGESSQSDYVV
ncbi:MAG: Ribosomal protein S12 methylthiotransferase RimO [Firmicutes bacterium]|nr:Ribosomal protein S12 methylthiotransferase RimO [candidate division NPL-UPA2 bacterium]